MYETGTTALGKERDRRTQGEKEPKKGEKSVNSVKINNHLKNKLIIKRRVDQKQLVLRKGCLVGFN